MALSGINDICSSPMEIYFLDILVSCISLLGSKQYFSPVLSQVSINRYDFVTIGLKIDMILNSIAIVKERLSS